MQPPLRVIGTAAITALLLLPMVILQQLLPVHVLSPALMELHIPLLLQKVRQYVLLMHHQILLRWVRP